jgi:hypothetical protein
MKAVTIGNYQYWRDLRKDLKKYSEQKNRVYEMVVDELEERFPKVKE